MSGGIEANAKPLPVILKAARDELLSSWLARHARFYGVTGPFFAKWLVGRVTRTEGTVLRA